MLEIAYLLAVIVQYWLIIFVFIPMGYYIFLFILTVIFDRKGGKSKEVHIPKFK